MLFNLVLHLVHPINYLHGEKWTEIRMEIIAEVGYLIVEVQVDSLDQVEEEVVEDVEEDEAEAEFLRKVIFFIF